MIKIPHKDNTPEGLLKELEYDVECLGKLKSTLFLDLISADAAEIADELVRMGVDEKEIKRIWQGWRRNDGTCEV